MGEDFVKEKLDGEEQIVEMAKTDDRSFEILYNHYFPKIYGYIYKRVGSTEIAEDIVSDTFLKVFCNLKKYNYQGYSFSAWIYRIATNNLVDYYRKSGRSKEIKIDSIQGFSDEENPSPFEKVASVYERSIVRSAISCLSEKDQKVLYLKFFAELDINEIAKTMQISENNARVLVHRAIKKFDQIYKNYVK